MWVTTDTYGDKLIWEKKPERAKNGKEWINGGAVGRLGEFPLTDIPSFIQAQEWKDAPIQVKFEIKKK